MSEDDNEYYDIDEFSLRHEALTMSIVVNQDAEGVVKSTQGVAKIDRIIKDANKIREFLGAKKTDAQIKLLIQ